MLLFFWVICFLKAVNICNFNTLKRYWRLAICWKMHEPLMINNYSNLSGTFYNLNLAMLSSICALLQSFSNLVERPLLVDLTIEEGQRLKVIYGSNHGFHAIDLDTSQAFDIYIPSQVCNSSCWLTAHLQSFPSISPFQSAYRKFHSTETVLFRIQNVLLLANDQRKLSALVLLDLSAAFDTIDHQLLLTRLSSTSGLTGLALRMLTSYLSE